MDLNQPTHNDETPQPPAIAKTKRAFSAGIEQHLFKEFKVLDKGFVRVIDYMGNDQAIVQAARVSYGSGTKSSRNDERLIRYLMRHHHSTPFEMCEIKLHVKLPIFVARQWIRHRTANVNEYSARYSILEQEFYIPAPEHLAAQDETKAANKQGRASQSFSVGQAQAIIQRLENSNKHVYGIYQDMIAGDDDAPGLARELARINLPTSIYTQWYWKIDVHNLLHFIKLRADTHAQYEIRAYADVIAKIVADWMPMAYQAFQDYLLNSVTLCAVQRQCLERLLKGERVHIKTTNLTTSEWRLLLHTPGVQLSPCGNYAQASGAIGDPSLFTDQ